jgi:hypothetical protein
VTAADGVGVADVLEGGGLRAKGLYSGLGAGAGPPPAVVTTGAQDGPCFKERATDSGRGTAGNGTFKPGSVFTMTPPAGDKPF